MKEFLKSTIVGGAVFLLPVALVGFILSRALRLTKGVAEPLAKGLQLDQLGSVAGMGAAAILSVLMLVLVSSALGFRRFHGCRQAYYPMVGKFFARQSAAIPPYE